jgi:YfiH family protein
MYHSFTSTTHDGNMSYRFDAEEEVDGNRAAFFKRIGMQQEHVAVMEVEHGVQSICVSSTDFASPGTQIFLADALTTNDPRVALFLLTADCLPVVCYDAQREALALLHLGWRSVVHGLVEQVVRSMEMAYGTCPQDVQVTIGPSIKQASYVHDEVMQQGEGWAPYMAKSNSGRIHIDLQGYVASKLVELGVQKHCIEISPIDTALDTDYFSHYRSVHTMERSGRFATICWL